MEMSACTGSFKKLLQGRSNMRDGVCACVSVDPRGAAGVCAPVGSGNYTPVLAVSTVASHRLPL